MDTSCNATSSCVSCTPGFYLSAKKCLNCANLPANCISCDATTPCIKCTDGYYVSNSACVACPANCLTCSSASFCNTAADGYYIQTGLKGTSTGIFKPCRSPCATCKGDAKMCLTCVKGYSINGTQCLSDTRV